jgi:hypothetical protein
MAAADDESPTTASPTALTRYTRVKAALGDRLVGMGHPVRARWKVETAVVAVAAVAAGLYWLPWDALRPWQQGLGAIVGSIALAGAALLNYWLQRQRDDQILAAKRRRIIEFLREECHWVVYILVQNEEKIASWVSRGDDLNMVRLKILRISSPPILMSEDVGWAERERSPASGGIHHIHADLSDFGLAGSARLPPALPIRQRQGEEGVAGEAGGDGGVGGDEGVQFGGRFRGAVQLGQERGHRHVREVRQRRQARRRQARLAARQAVVGVPRQAERLGEGGAVAAGPGSDRSAARGDDPSPQPKTRAKGRSRSPESRPG